MDNKLNLYYHNQFATCNSNFRNISPIDASSIHSITSIKENMKYLLLVLVIPLLIIVFVFISLFFGSLIRFINEGSSFKNPFDDNRPMHIALKDKEFWKTLLTGFFVCFTLLIIAKYLSGE